MSTEQLLILGGAGLLSMVIVAIGIFTARSDEDFVERRLEEATNDSFQTYGDEDDQAVDKGEGRAIEALDSFFANRKFGQKWRIQLARANLKLTIGEFAALHIISTLGVFAVGYFVLFSGDIVFSIIGGFVGFLFPRIYVSRKISSRLREFETQLPDTLSLWTNALRSGYSALQSMEAIARDSSEPTKTEFHRVVQEVQLGIDMGDALQHMLDRVESEDLDLVITAVNINREVGGNLAEILAVIGHTIRERIKLKGEIRVLTAQGRITGYLISFLPIVLALFLQVVSPGFINPLFDNRACGWPLLGVGLAMIGIGAAVVQKIVDIDI
ncbi:MAG: secretion system protein [Anaerolineaceae bacterium]|nr:MAG: secretion system protein [Anaerolineaceae bacterium]